MKKIYQILLMIIFALLLFYSNKVFNIYNKSVTYLGNKIYLSFYQNNNLDYVGNNSNENGIKNTNEAKKVIEPGALKLDTTSTNKIELSAKNIINITNQDRKKNGKLPPLVENEKLDFTAEKKLQDMFTKQYFEHISPTGIGVVNLADQVSYKYIIIGENLALGGFKNDRDLMKAWMASPGHRANILNKNYTEIGIAVSKGIFDGRTVWIAVQHFGLPKSVCSSIDKTLSLLISSNEKNIKMMSSEFAIRLDKINNKEVYENLTVKQQINEYNSLVLIYNRLITKVKNEISNYNKQVDSFNSCINSYIK